MTSVRRLEREFGLLHVIMLGTAGTISASVFVLTGHVAGRMGPASVVLLVTLGLLNTSIALNYAELGTTYPVTGGALTYVREAYGAGLLSFLVGSLDCLSGAFYAALSAIGFAYSVQVLLPFLPIVPTALVVIGLFTLLNVLGTNYVGRAQLLLGGLLLTLLAVYVIGGLASPTGFTWETFMPDGELFIHDGFGANLMALFGAFSLVFNSFVGFEIIADDAEEVQNPNRNLPMAILISLGLVTFIYTIVVLVTLGTVPWFELAGSEKALSMAAEVSLPHWGTPLVAAAGIIATLTSCNTAILASTHEALTLGRNGLWPEFMSRLGRLRAPYAAASTVGAIAGLMTIVGVVEFLSYISSTGYLFVVFWASLAMVRLHKLFPDIERPFEAPLFPLTAYMAAGVSSLATAFASPTALAFLGGLVLLLMGFWYLRPVVNDMMARRAEAAGVARDRLLVAVANPRTAEGLVHLAGNLSEQRVGSPIEILAVAPVDHEDPPTVVDRLSNRYAHRQDVLLRRVSNTLGGGNVPFFTQVRMASGVAEGIMEEIEQRGDVRLLLMGWPGRLSEREIEAHPVTGLLEAAPVDMAVFINRGIVARPLRVLVPFGGGIHSRLALRLAMQLVEPQEGEVVALRCFLEAEAETGEAMVLDEEEVVDIAFEQAPVEDEEMHDEMMLAYESIEAELGEVPENMGVKVIHEPDVKEGILQELTEQEYDLVVMGAAVAHTLESDLFGSLTDAIAETLPLSVLLVRRHEPGPVNWMRRQVKEVVETAAEENAEDEAEEE